MLRLLADFSINFGPLRIFDSITFRSVLALIFAFAVTVWLAPGFIARMRKRNVTENMDKDSAAIAAKHSGKAGTPTMGGSLILVAVAFATVFVCNLANPLVLLGSGIFLGYGLLGLTDDYMKLKKLGKNGLSKRQKILGQIIIAGLVVMGLVAIGDVNTTKILIPFTKWSEVSPDVGWLYYPFAIFVIVACSNAVNLTDGLDGLASGCTIMVTATFAVFAYVAGNVKLCEHFLLPHVNGAGELSIICAGLIGAVMGFLWFNAHPAKVFMGDTGSLAIGALLGYVALVSKQELVLPIIGGIFVAEALSVIIQVFSYKTWKKRVFLCAPLHHHLELSGWSENHVVVRLWMIGALLAAAGLSTLKLH